MNECLLERGELVGTASKLLTMKGTAEHGGAVLGMIDQH
jgi:hypothetical protein